jgi:hypothetical protein
MDDTTVAGEPRYEECRQRDPEWCVRDLDDCVAADLEVSLDGASLGGLVQPLQARRSPTIGGLSGLRPASEAQGGAGGLVSSSCQGPEQLAL